MKISSLMEIANSFHITVNTMQFSKRGLKYNQDIHIHVTLNAVLAPSIFFKITLVPRALSARDGVSIEYKTTVKITVPYKNKHKAMWHEKKRIILPSIW